jgi:hypothetical protein
MRSCQRRARPLLLAAALQVPARLLRACCVQETLAEYEPLLLRGLDVFQVCLPRW